MFFKRSNNKLHNRLENKEGTIEELISSPLTPPQLQREEMQSQPRHSGSAGWQQTLEVCGLTPAHIRANFTAAACDEGLKNK